MIINAISTGDPPLESHQEKSSIPFNSCFVKIGGSILDNFNTMKEYFMNSDKYPFILSMLCVPCEPNLTFIEFTSLDEATKFYGDCQVITLSRISSILSKTNRLIPQKICGYPIVELDYGQYHNDPCILYNTAGNCVLLKVIPKIDGSPPKRLFFKPKLDNKTVIDSHIELYYDTYKGMSVVDGYSLLKIQPNVIKTWSANFSDEAVSNLLYFDVRFWSNDTKILAKEFNNLNISTNLHFLISQLTPDQLNDNLKIILRNLDIYTNVQDRFNYLLNRKDITDSLYSQLKINIQKIEKNKIYCQKCKERILGKLYLLKLFKKKSLVVLKESLKNEFDKFYGTDLTNKNFKKIEKNYGQNYISRKCHPPYCLRDFDVFEDYFEISDKVDDFIDQQILKYEINEPSDLQMNGDQVAEMFHLIAPDKDDFEEYITQEIENYSHIKVHDLLKMPDGQIGIAVQIVECIVKISNLKMLQKRSPHLVEARLNEVEIVSDDKIVANNNKKINIGTMVYSDRDVPMKVLHLKDDYVYGIDFQDQLFGVRREFVSTSVKDSMINYVPLYRFGADVGAFVGTVSAKYVQLKMMNNLVIQVPKNKATRLPTNKFICEFWRDPTVIITPRGPPEERWECECTVIGFFKRMVLVRRKAGRGLNWVDMNRIVVLNANEEEPAPKFDVEMEKEENNEKEDMKENEAYKHKRVLFVGKNDRDKIAKGDHVFVKVGGTSYWATVVSISDPMCCIKVNSFPKTHVITIPSSFITRIVYKSDFR